jgi:hypothetical protein
MTLGISDAKILPQRLAAFVAASQPNKEAVLGSGVPGSSGLVRAV